MAWRRRRMLLLGLLGLAGLAALRAGAAPRQPPGGEQPPEERPPEEQPPGEGGPGGEEERPPSEETGGREEEAGGGLEEGSPPEACILLPDGVQEICVVDGYVRSRLLNREGAHYYRIVHAVRTDLTGQLYVKATPDRIVGATTDPGECPLFERSGSCRIGRLLWSFNPDVGGAFVFPLPRHCRADEPGVCAFRVPSLAPGTWLILTEDMPIQS